MEQSPGEHGEVERGAPLGLRGPSLCGRALPTPPPGAWRRELPLAQGAGALRMGRSCSVGLIFTFTPSWFVTVWFIS